MILKDSSRKSKLRQTDFWPCYSKGASLLVILRITLAYTRVLLRVQICQTQHFSAASQQRIERWKRSSHSKTNINYYTLMLFRTTVSLSSRI